MSLSSAVSRVDYTGNGVTTTYAYTFKIFDETDLVVTKRSTAGVETTLVLTTDYTVTGVGETAGGNVVLNSALTSGYALTIRRVRPLTQATSIRNQSAYYAATHEDTFDKLVMIDQQQQDEIDRSFKLPETVDPDDFSNEIPAGFVGNGGKLLISNDDGDGWDVGPDASDIADAQSNAAAAAASASDAADSAADAAASASDAADSAADAAAFASVSGFTSATPALDDYVAGSDTSAGNVNKKFLVSGIKFPGYRAVSTSQALTSADEIVSVTGTSITVGPVTAVGNTGKQMRIINANSSLADYVTITPAGGTIGGLSSYVLYSPGEVVDIVSDGTNWIIIGRVVPSVWTAYTPTVGNLGTGSGTSSGRWRRVGDSMYIDIYFLKDGSGGSGASNVTWSIPSNATIDTNKLAASGTRNVGSGVTYGVEAASQLHPAIFLYNNTTSMVIADIGSGSSYKGTDMRAASEVSGRILVPIVGWT